MKETRFAVSVTRSIGRMLRAEIEVACLANRRTLSTERLETHNRVNEPRENYNGICLITKEPLI